MSESVFAWKAESPDGRSLSGTLDSADPVAAGDQLKRLGLRVMEVTSVARRAGRPLSHDDFHAFNLQLAQLTAAGLPLEQGLRLVARDMRRGRLSRVVDEVAADLEKGVPLAEAFDRRRGRFPILYGRLLDAGVRMGNLPGVLLSLGEHLQLVQRLRASLWNVLSYPGAVLVALAAVLSFVHLFVQPKVEQLWADFHMEVPYLAVVATGVLNAAPWLIGGLLALLLLGAFTALLFRLRGKGQSFTDYLILPIPLVGAIVHRSLLSRWCHAVALGVEAGQDLPAAISLAGDAIGSPRLTRDGQVMVDALGRGVSLDQVGGLGVLPLTIPAAMQIGSGTGTLPLVMRNLAALYQRQAEYRAQSLPAVLTPVLLILLGLFVAVCVVALFAPIVALFNAISGL